VITSFGTCNLPLSGRNGACSEVAQVGSTRSYTAQPFAGSQFVSWGGPCAGQTGTTCTLSPVAAGGTVTARFDLTPTQVLTVEGINSVTPGTGTVTSAPAGISCGITGNQETGTCTGTFALGANVSLTPVPAAGSVFSAWSGACTGSTVPCVVPMTGPQTVGALFVPVASSALTILGSAISSDSGSGVVTSVSPSGISCNVSGASTSNTCGASYPLATSVTLSAAPLSTSLFAGWTGACSGTSPTCVVTMSQARTVGARFVPELVNLTLNFDPATTGYGFVSAGGLAINCRTNPPINNNEPFGNACAGTPVDNLSSITLNASSEDASSGFIGWAPASPCTGVRSSSCTFTIDRPTTVRVRFGASVPTPLTIDATDAIGTATVTVQTVRGTTTHSAPTGQTLENTLPPVRGGHRDLHRVVHRARRVRLLGLGACQAFESAPTCTLVINGSQGAVRAIFSVPSGVVARSAARRPTRPGPPAPVARPAAPPGRPRP
jgi:hypothetical protein